MSEADDRNDQEAKGARYEQIFKPRLYPSTKREALDFRYGSPEPEKVQADDTDFDNVTGRRTPPWRCNYARPASPLCRCR
jgi:hypothetical protein